MREQIVLDDINFKQKIIINRPKDDPYFLEIYLRKSEGGRYVKTHPRKIFVGRCNSFYKRLWLAEAIEKWIEMDALDDYLIEFDTFDISLDEYTASSHSINLLELYFYQESIAEYGEGHTFKTYYEKYDEAKDRYYTHTDLKDRQAVKLKKNEEGLILADRTEHLSSGNKYLFDNIMKNFEYLQNKSLLI